MAGSAVDALMALCDISDDQYIYKTIILVVEKSRIVTEGERLRITLTAFRGCSSVDESI